MVKKLGKVGKHKQDMMSLKEKDPSFYKFLEENDKELLKFGESYNDEEEEGEEMEIADDDEGDEEDVQFNDGDDNDDNNDDDENQDDFDDDIEEEDNEEENEIELIDVTQSMFDEAFEQSKTGSYSMIKKVLSYFRAACIPYDENDEANQNQAKRYVVNNPEVYNNIMVNVLENLHVSIKLLFQESSSDPEKEFDFSQADKHPQWKKYKTIVSSFFKSLLSSLSSAQYTNSDKNETTNSIGVFLLNSLKEYIFLLHCQPRLSRGVLKVLIAIWSQGQSQNIDSNSIVLRGNVFLRIRQMSLNLSGTITEEIFRSVYLAFARVCKSYNENTSSSVDFMMECVCQLFLSDDKQAYQIAFLYIRQLALHLRTVILKKNTENTKKLATWQYLNCLRLWTRVVCSMPTENKLKSLIFPLSQVMIGLISTIQSFYYLPLKFHIIFCLQQLAAAGNIFIPTGPKLYEILETMSELNSNSNSTASTEAPPILKHLIKFSANSINFQVVKDLIIQEIIFLLQVDSDLYKYNVGYPEYMYLTIKKLRSFSKNSKIVKWKDLCKALITQFEDQSSIVKKNRLLLNKSVFDIFEFESLLPENSPNMNLRMLKFINRKQQEYGVKNNIVLDQNKNNKFSNKNNKKQNIDDENEEDDDEEESGNKKSKNKKRNLQKQVNDKNSKKTKKDNKNNKNNNEKNGNNNDQDEVHEFSWSDDEN